MKKIIVSIFFILFCCSSCSILSNKRDFIEQQIKDDYETFLYFKHNGQSILDLKNYSFESRNENVAFFFDVDVSKGTYRIILTKKETDVKFIKDTIYNSYEFVDLTKDLRASKFLKTAYVCDSIFKLANCGYYNYPRIGHDLRYYRDNAPLETGNLIKINKNWFYSMNRWTGHNRKFAIRCFFKYFLAGKN